MLKYVEIKPYVFIVPEAKPRDTKHAVGIISIWHFNKTHILNTWSKPYCIFPIDNDIFILQKIVKV